MSTTSLVDKAERNIEKRIKAEHEQQQRAAAVYRQRLAALRKATEYYIETGIAYADGDAGTCINEALCQKAKDYFESLAKNLDRPLLFADIGHAYHYNGTGWENRPYIKLAIPCNKRMENLASPLLILATPYDQRTFASHDVSVESNARSWKFYFAGDSGKQRLLEFIDMCRTNPIAKILLKTDRR